MANVYMGKEHFNVFDLALQTAERGRCVEWLREIGLLARVKLCHLCQSPMTEGPNARIADGIRWRCNRRTCRTQASIRDGSFFSGSNLPLDKIVKILYFYSYEMSSFQNLERECRIAKEAMTNWRNYVRDVYAEYLILHPRVIGGPGETVEIDESAFVRRKYNRGRQINTQWVFGGICVRTKLGFLVPVDQRDAQTLLPIIQQYILPGTTVISDQWAAYNAVGTQGYQHLTVNHRLNFVDPVTHATTKHVEAMWGRAKQRNKRDCGTARALLDSYLIEFMWRQQFGEEPFLHLIEHIREIYPL